MSMKGRLVAILCTLAASGMAHANERTWTDASGKYKVTGTLVRERDGQVQIRCADGRLVVIDASRLAKTDTDFIRAGGRGSSDGAAHPGGGRSPDSTPVVATAARKPAANAKGGGSAPEGTKEVVAEGVGISKEEALKDAFRAAIRQVVGEVVDSDVQVQNDKLIKDEILTYSDGFIPRHEVTATTIDRGIHRVTVRATVERRSVVAKLRAAKITVKHLEDDGESVVVRLGTDREAREAAKAMVAKAFVGFPSDQLEARVLDSNATEDEGNHITLAVRVEIAPAADAYQAFQERLCQRLKDLAKIDGEFSTKMGTHEADDRDPCRLPRIGQPNYFSDSMPQLMPDVDESVDRTGVKPQWPMVFAVATLVSKDHTRIDWRYFVLDGVTGDKILSVASQQATCKLTFLDASDKPVAVDRFDPCRDEFLPSSAVGNVRAFKIPWNKYLVKVWYRDLNYGHEKCFNGLEEFEPPGTGYGTQYIQDQHKPAIAFVAPVFFGCGYNNNLLYVPKITLTRHVRLTEDEVRPIKKVRCEMTFRKGVDASGER